MIRKGILLMGVFLLPLFAQAQVAKFKAVFTMNFIRYIGWPEETKQGDFVIGVLKNREVTNYMKAQSQGKKFGFQDVVVKEFKSVEDIVDCQVIFVSSNVNFSKHASAIIDKVGGSNTLIITESEGATKYGSMINFVVRDGKLKFEIHKGNAANFGTPISSRLGNMASAISL